MGESINTSETTNNSTADAESGFLHKALDSLESISMLNLVKGYGAYFAIVRGIFKFPYTFPEKTEVDSPEAFGQSARVAIYTVIVLFVLLVPIMVLHKESVPKIPFVIRNIFYLYLYCLVMHLGFLIFGVRKVSIKTTITLHLFFMAFFSPMNLLLSYPILVVGGTKVLFIELANVQELEALLKPEWLIITTAIVQSIFNVFASILFLKWLKYTHGLVWWKSLFAIVLAGFLFSPFQFFLLNPLFNKLAEMFERYLYFI